MPLDKFYVYALLDPRETGIWKFEDKEFSHKPFYIGKGIKDRSNIHFCKSRRKERTYKSCTIKSIELQGLKPIIIKIFENLKETKSFTKEIELIKYFGRSDINTGILTNHTDGGEGRSGYKYTEEQRYKASQKEFDRVKSKDYISKVGIPTSKSKVVYQYDMKGNYLTSYNVINDLKRQFGFDPSSIRKVCKKDFGCYKHFQWRYYKVEKIESRIYKARRSKPTKPIYHDLSKL